jgi:hypothetical protein
MEFITHKKITIMKKDVLFITAFLAFCCSALSQQWSEVPGFNSTYPIRRLQLFEGELNILGRYPHPSFAPEEDIRYPGVVFNGEMLSFPYPESSTAFNSNTFDCVARFQGSCFMGGRLTRYPEIETTPVIFSSNNGLVRMDSSGVHQVNGGTGFTSTVYDLEVFQDKLAASGGFTFPVSSTAPADSPLSTGIVLWNGEDWEQIGGVVNAGGVYELLTYDEKLWLFGSFSQVYTNSYITEDEIPQWVIEARNLAWWDGEQWGSTNGGANQRILDAVVDTVNNILYVCGEFSYMDYMPISRVAAWDGTNWYPVGSGLEGSAKSIEIYNGQLYVAGAALLSSNMWPNMSALVYFDGYNWQKVPGTEYTTGYFDELCVYQDKLYAAGDFEMFNEAGFPTDITNQRLVCYYQHPDSVVWGVPASVDDISATSPLHIYPNPVSDVLHIRAESIPHAQLKLLDSTGRVVLEESLKGTSHDLDVSALASGTYYISLYSRGSMMACERVVVE